MGQYGSNIWSCTGACQPAPLNNSPQLIAEPKAIRSVWLLRMVTLNDCVHCHFVCEVPVGRFPGKHLTGRKLGHLESRRDHTRYEPHTQPFQGRNSLIVSSVGLTSSGSNNPSVRPTGGERHQRYLRRYRDREYVWSVAVSCADDSPKSKVCEAGTTTWGNEDIRLDSP